MDLASKDRILHASTFMYFVGLTNTTLNENLEDTDGEKSNRHGNKQPKKTHARHFPLKSIGGAISWVLNGTETPV